MELLTRRLAWRTKPLAKPSKASVAQCSDKLKADGAAQEAKGDVQKAVGDAKNATKEAIDKAAGATKKPL